MKALDTIRIFVLTLKTGSLSAAGRKLGLSPATISRRIASLEEELGVQLLDRMTRNQKPTEAGYIFYQRMASILDEISQVETAVQEYKLMPEGRLRIHSRTLVGIQCITPILQEFSMRYPNINLELDLSEEPVNLLDEDFDVDIRVGQVDDSSYLIRKLCNTQDYLVASPGYINNSPSISCPEDLLSHKCLGWRRSKEPTSWRYMSDGEVKTLSINSFFYSNNGEALRRAAINGQGIALLGAITVRESIRDGSLVRVLPEHRFCLSNFNDGLYVVFRPTRPIPFKVRVFIDFLVEKFKN